MGRIRWAIVLLALMLPAEAKAQTATTSVELPKWDVGGTLNIRFGREDDTVIPLGAWTAEVGRYWTPHVKTSFAMMTAGQTTSGGATFDPSFTTYTTIVTRPAAFAVTASYQFFDNEFVHPYVSAGARFASTSTVTDVYSRSPSALVRSTTTERIEVRPIAGGGFKSYFGNGRAFMRSELLMSADPRGSLHAILQIGAGVDF
jgi:hypothetical protein